MMQPLWDTEVLCLRETLHFAMQALFFIFCTTGPSCSGLQHGLVWRGASSGPVRCFSRKSGRGTGKTCLPRGDSMPWLPSSHLLVRGTMDYVVEPLRTRVWFLNATSTSLFIAWWSSLHSGLHHSWDAGSFGWISRRMSKAVWDTSEDLWNRPLLLTNGFKVKRFSEPWRPVTYRDDEDSKSSKVQTSCWPF